MKWTDLKSAKFALLALALTGSFNIQSDTHWYGGNNDTEFAITLWQILLDADLVGENAQPDTPYLGTHPHGAILESVIATVAIEGTDRTIVVKRSYRGKNVSVESVSRDRSRFLDDITVMLKREDGYDSENQNWFWVKYNRDGTLSATPNGLKLAGRIAKGKSKGCIACHRKAPGDDFLFVN